MPLSPGARLGPYEVIAPAGAGGMGEVWKARDTRLERSVAIKVLPAEYAQNAQLKLRFEREAKSISQLNHPHICTLYDVGHQDGVDYIVMEYLEGETLSERIARGRLPLAETLRVGAQIADALDRAHRAGIVHRDLKPGNVMLTRSGAKLLDFGLAKVASQPVISLDGATQQATQKKSLTAEGTILGTLQYMAPEQLEGLEADARTDIFALGEILYEMATGRRAFQAKSNTSLIAAIMTGEPQPLASIEPLTPPAFEHVVRKCLSKDPEARWQSAWDIGEQLRWIADHASVADEERAAKHGPARRARLLAAIAAAAVAGVLGWWAAAQWQSRHARMPLYRLTISTPPGSILGYHAGPMALSPDGQLLTYASYGREGNSLVVRKLSETTWRPIEGTTGAHGPFWSDDGRQIAYFARGALWRVTADGSGSPEEIAKQPSLGAATGSWHGATILLAVAGQLFRVSSSGGDPVRLNVLGGDVRIFFPEFLPDGSHFIFTAARKASVESEYYVASIDAKAPPRRIGSGDNNAAYSDGHLFFVRASTLFAEPFDVRAFAASGAPSPVAKVQSYSNQKAYFSVAGNTIVYLPAGSEVRTQLERVDRSGKTISAIGQPAFIFSPRLSHRGTRVAVDRSVTTGPGDIWLVDTATGGETRFTFAPENETAPVWTPSDGDIVYAISGTSRQTQALLRKSTAGGEPSVALAIAGAILFPGDFSPDGRYLMAFAGAANAGGTRLFAVSLPSWRATPVSDGSSVRVSPDNRWFAYAAFDAGVGGQQVFVEPLPPNGSKWQISSDGGSMPVWRPDGKALFFVNETGKLVESTVSATADGAFAWQPPQPLFGVALREGISIAAQYDVFPDGTFLLNRIPEAATTPMTIVINWQQAVAK